MFPEPKPYQHKLFQLFNERKRAELSVVQIKLTIKYNLSADFDNLQHSAEIIFAFGEYSNNICTKKTVFFH